MHLCTGGSELCAPGTAADTDSETDSKPVCALISVLYSVCNPVGHDSAGDILRYVIFSVTSNPLAGIAALILAGLTAWFSSNLFLSAAVASIAVLIVQMLV